MSIISLSHITKTFGPVCVFNGLTVAFHAGQKVGLIGQNGSGKTTLFRIILGQESPDTGSVSIQKDLKIGYLPQEPDFQGDKSVFEVMLEGLGDLTEKQRRMETLSDGMGTLSGSSLRQAMAEYDRLAHEVDLEGGWSSQVRIRSVLTGLGLPEAIHRVPVSALSGGQRSRLGLARVLLRQTDLLLLDEPTNHLDLQAICWLETYLKNYPGAVILICHDRFLLDQLADRIVEIEDKKAVSYRGSYSQYIQLKQQHRLHRERELRKREEFVRDTLDFIARNKDQEGMRKTARGRKTRLRRLLSERPDFLEKVHEKQTISFQFSESVSRSEKILSAEGISKGFGDHVLFQRLSLSLQREGRLAITGPNGSGKSTLLKVLLGQLPPDEGVIDKGEHLVFGYLDQHARTLRQENTVLQEAASVRPDLSQEQLRSRLAAFLFRGEQVFQKTISLSGGQRNRLMLCKLVLAEPDVLVLDEPTNHLDIESCEVFENALLDYGGSVVAVSHDRYFIDRSFDSLLVLGLNRAGQRCPGFFEWVKKGIDGQGVYSLWSRQIEETAKLEPSSAKDSAKRTDCLRKPSYKAPPEIRQFNALSIEDLEMEILIYEEQIDSLNEQFGQEAIYKNPSLLKELKDKVDRKKGELELLYRAYEWRIRK